MKKVLLITGGFSLAIFLLFYQIIQQVGFNIDMKALLLDEVGIGLLFLVILWGLAAGFRRVIDAVKKHIDPAKNEV